MTNQTAPYELLVGTRNPGKVREIATLLGDLNLKLRSLADFPSVPEVEEAGKTYEENSSLKALTYAGLTGLQTLADDSGLEVEALGGMPGPLSARFGGEFASDADRIKKLLLALKNSSSDVRTAQFVCCMSLAGWVDSGDARQGAPTLLSTARGTLPGRIISEARGNNGFGYDPIFVPDGFDRTLAELPAEVKNQISHRAKALAQIKDFLAGSGKLDR